MDGYLAEGFHGRERECLGVSRKRVGWSGFQERGKAELFRDIICM